MRATILCLFLLVCKLSAKPLDDEKSIVVTTTSTTTEAGTTKSDKVQEDDAEQTVPKIYKMNVHSKIENRYANTTVTSKVRNLGKKAQEATFFVVLPDSAFISGFIMEIDGKNYTAYVQEKKKAQETYDQAVQSGIGAGHIAVSARDSNKFTVSVNIEPQSKATFYLNYEELLKRINGYEMVINIHPKQPVPQLEVDVEINESSPLKYVKAPPIRSGNDVRPTEGDLDSRAVIDKVNDTYATISFKPNEERQKQLANSLGTKEDEGLSGQFVIQYEVERENNGGEVLLKDGHFVHFFSPDDSQQLPKYVLFVLDTSGSMYGEKIDQLKQAMHKILPDLKEDDLFNLIEFNSQVKVWDINNENNSVSYPDEDVVWNYNSTSGSYDNLTFPEAYVPSKENVAKAEKIIDTYTPNGGTNIFEALKIAIHLNNLQSKKNKDFNKQPLIIFLTDGDPTVGVTSTEEIISKLSEENLRQIPIFSLSFGSGADQSFLRKLSLHNYAFSRHIYEGADASIQLENFYKRVSSPLLKDVHFKYTKDVEKVTKTHFPIFFRGDEYIVTGKIANFEEIPQVEAWGIHGPIQLKPIVKETTGELERLWAYLTIKQLLDDKETAKNKTDYEKKALDLALKYSFVTPVSSLVVVKPNATKAVDTEAADNSNEDHPIAIRLSSPVVASGSFYNMKRTGVAPLYALGGHLSADAFSSASFAGIPGPPAYGFAGAAGGGGAYRPQFAPAPTFVPGVPGQPPTYIPEASTTFKPFNSPLDDLIAKLPWLQAILNPADNTIALPNGKYKLGFDAQVDESKECKNAYNNATGHCRLLYNCNHVVGQNLINTVDLYTNHFCNIDEYAGICCPIVP